jgi:hypothetical protein
MPNWLARAGKPQHDFHDLVTLIVSSSKEHLVIHIIRSRATKSQIADMLETLETYIKLAVDIRRGILAGGGTMHADCEAALLEDGSQQEDIWGADWNPESQQVTFESLINIRPRQNNRSLEIVDPVICDTVAHITRQLLGDL